MTRNSSDSSSETCSGEARNSDSATKKPATAAKAAEKPADAAVTAPTGPRLDAEIVAAAATAKGVVKVKIEAEADGSVREMSLYHNDESALPAAVTALREAQYPGSKVRAYETEFDREHGRVFEIEVTTRDKQECELSAKPDGTLDYNECHVPAKTHGAAVLAAIEKTVPGAKIGEAEKKTHADGKVVVSVEVTAGGKQHELYFEGDALVRHELILPAEIEVPVK
jgi:hypothetical protein